MLSNPTTVPNIVEQSEIVMTKFPLLPVINCPTRGTHTRTHTHTHTPTHTYTHTDNDTDTEMSAREECRELTFEDCS